MEEDEEDASSHATRFCGRRSAFANSELAEGLASRVSDIHAIKVDATELICRYLTRCADTGATTRVPVVDQTFVRAVLNEVTTGPRDTLQPYPLLTETRRDFLADAARPSRSGLDQVFNATTRSFVTTYNTNLFLHFYKRLLKTFKRLHQAEEGFDKAERRLHARTGQEVGEALLDPGDAGALHLQDVHTVRRIVRFMRTGGPEAPRASDEEEGHVHQRFGRVGTLSPFLV